DRRVGRSVRGVVARLHGQARRGQQDLDVGLGAQRIHEGGVALAEPLLAHAGLDALEGVGLARSAEARLVLLVEGLLLRLRDRSDLRVDLLLEQLVDADLARRRLALDHAPPDGLVQGLALGLVLLGADLEQAWSRQLLPLAGRRCIAAATSPTSWSYESSPSLNAPLTNSVGVPVTPSARPSARSSRTSSRCRSV